MRKSIALALFLLFDLHIIFSHNLFFCESELSVSPAQRIFLYNQLLRNFSDITLEEYFRLPDLSLRTVDYSQLSSELQILKQSLEKLGPEHSANFLEAAKNFLIEHAQTLTQVKNSIRTEGTLKPKTFGSALVYASDSLVEPIGFTADSKNILLYSVNLDIQGTEPRTSTPPVITTLNLATLEKYETKREDLQPFTMPTTANVLLDRETWREKKRIFVYDPQTQSQYIFQNTRSSDAKHWNLHWYAPAPELSISRSVFPKVFKKISSDTSGFNTNLTVWLEHFSKSFHVSIELKKIIINITRGDFEDFYAIELTPQTGEPKGLPQRLFSVSSATSCIEPQGRYIYFVREKPTKLIIEKRELQTGLIIQNWSVSNTSLRTINFCSISPDLKFIALDTAIRRKKRDPDALFAIYKMK